MTAVRLPILISTEQMEAFEIVYKHEASLKPYPDGDSVLFSFRESATAQEW